MRPCIFLEGCVRSNADPDGGLFQCAGSDAAAQPNRYFNSRNEN